MILEELKYALAYFDGVKFILKEWCTKKCLIKITIKKRLVFIQENVRFEGRGETSTMLNFITEYSNTNSIIFTARNGDFEF